MRKVIIDTDILSMFAKIMSLLCSSSFLAALYSRVQEYADIIENYQVLAFKQSGSAPAKILIEGRKFGLSMILATQTLSNLHPEERDRLFQVSRKLFFKPAETEVREYAKILEHSTNEKVELWIKRLSSLGKGECYAFGPTLNPANGNLEEKAFPIKVTALAKRIA